MSSEKCPVCEAYCPSTGCSGFPDAVRTRQGWKTYDEAAAFEKAGGFVDWTDIWSYARYGLLVDERPLGRGGKDVTATTQGQNRTLPEGLERMSEQTDNTPQRPDIDALRITNPESPGVLCFNATYLRELVAYVEHLELATGMARDYSTLSPTVSTAYLIVKVQEDHFTRGMACFCGVPVGDSVDMRWHLANQIERALKQRGAL